MAPVMELSQIGHRITGGVGSAGPDEISHVVNVAACAGCAAEGEARGRPGWDRAEGGRNGRLSQGASGPEHRVGLSHV